MAKSTKPRKGKESYGRRKGSQECEQEKKAAENKQQSWAVMKNILTCKHLQVEPAAAAAAAQRHKQLQLQEDDEITNTGIINIKRSSKKMRCSGSLSLSLSLCNNTNTNTNTNPNSNLNLNLNLNKVITERERRPTPATDPLQHSAANSNTSPPPPPPDQLLLLYRRKGSASSSSSFSTISQQTGSSSTSNRSFVSTRSSATLLSTPSLNKRGTAGSHFKGLPFRKLSLSGCSECTTVAVDPLLAGLTRDPSLRSTISSCPQCGDVFMKPDLLQLHQATKHAVSELGPEDTSRNIVEIIFQSSWLKKEAPVCKIDRILKVHNTSRTVSRFEEYRDMIKGKATSSSLPKKHPRCIADGNELLRFHCTTLMCSLGLHGSSNLCNSSPSCSVCGIIRDGFKTTGGGGGCGILTTATSGRAHDQAAHEPRKAMLVCRVIAGRVKKPVALESESQGVDDESYDSVAGVGGGPIYSDLDELYVYNPKAILPCFVVIYTQSL